MNSRRRWDRSLVYLAMIAALAVTAFPKASFSAPAQQGRTRHFSETNHDVSGRLP